jgi:dTDP-4-amino-4,6-dideoxygalactose transaminase
MDKPKIWLSSPHMGGNEKQYVDDAFSSNWIAPLGPNVTGFEMILFPIYQMKFMLGL